MSFMLTGCSETSTATINPSSSPSQTTNSISSSDLLVDNDYVKVQVTDVTIMSEYFINVSVTIQNKTKSTILKALPVSITTNGFSLDASGSATIPPDETHTISSLIGTSMIKALGYEKAMKYTFAYAIYNSNSITNALTISDTYTYYPDGAKSYVDQAAVFPKDTQVLIDDDNIKLSVVEVNDGSEIFTKKTEPTVYFYTENKTNQKVTIDMTNMQGNGGMITLNTTEFENSLTANAKKLIPISYDSDADYQSFSTISCSIQYTIGDSTSSTILYSYTINK